MSRDVIPRSTALLSLDSLSCSLQMLLIHARLPRRPRCLCSFLPPHSLSTLDAGSRPRRSLALARSTCAAHDASFLDGTYYIAHPSVLPSDSPSPSPHLAIAPPRVQPAHASHQPSRRLSLSPLPLPPAPGLPLRNLRLHAPSSSSASKHNTADVPARRGHGHGRRAHVAARRPHDHQQQQHRASRVGQSRAEEGIGEHASFLPFVCSHPSSYTRSHPPQIACTLHPDAPADVRLTLSPTLRPSPRRVRPGPSVAFPRTYVPPVSQPAHFDHMPYRLAAHRACLPDIRAAGRPLRARRCTASGSVIVPCPCHDAHADADVVVPHAHSPARRTEDRGSCPSHLTSARRRDTSSYRRPAAIPAERTASVARTIPARRADGRDRTSLGAAHVDAVETSVRRAPSARGADTAQAVSGSISRPHSLETPTCAPAPPCVLAGPHAASHRL